MSKTIQKISGPVSGDELFETLKHLKIGGNTCLYTPEKCHEMAPLINEINQLKKEKNAYILAHSYVTPDIIYGVADCVGDSYELSKRAKEVEEDTIIFAAVKFMADTAKLLNPSKKVIIPSKNNGCSLADSITGAQVKEMRAQYPDYTFVCYINTTADVKAECDICVTSSNVYKIVEEYPNDKIYFLPDRLMAVNVIEHLKGKGIQKDIKYWDGSCYVHEEYDADLIKYFRTEFPDVEVVSHPECNDEVIKESDFVGSTSQMINHVKESKRSQFFLLTECGLIDRLKLEAPGKEFIGTCTMCRYMKSNSLAQIKRVLLQPDPEDIITIDADTRQRALNCIEQMFKYAG
jgi:quinolinate synthase